MVRKGFIAQASLSVFLTFLRRILLRGGSSQERPSNSISKPSENQPPTPCSSPTKTSPNKNENECSTSSPSVQWLHKLRSRADQMDREAVNPAEVAAEMAKLLKQPGWARLEALWLRRREDLLMRSGGMDPHEILGRVNELTMILGMAEEIMLDQARLANEAEGAAKARNVWDGLGADLERSTTVENLFGGS